METLEGYVHQPGRHCGTAALRNLSEYYHWEYDEAACFGFGGGLGFRYVDRSDSEWPLVSPCATGIEQTFVETLEIPHLVREGDDWEDAWGDVRGFVEDDDPVLLYLDSGPLEYLPDDAHAPPHVALAVGYDDEEDVVHLSDGATTDLQAVPTQTLREAWQVDGGEGTSNRYLVVTRQDTLTNEAAAAKGAVHGVTQYMLHPLDAPRATGAPGEEGLPALRSFGEALSAWANLDDPSEPVSMARQNLSWHGEDAAFRDLYADALDQLAPDAGLSREVVGGLRDIAAEWRNLEELLDDVLAADGDVRAAKLEEASILVSQLAEREAGFFRKLAADL